jgi:4'-phosphopantetheinyl transferase
LARAALRRYRRTWFNRDEMSSEVASSLASEWSLDRSEAHVWIADVRRHLPERIHLEALLGVREIERLRSFRVEATAERYAIAHGLLRRVLGFYARRPPERLRFRADAFGKPQLVHEAGELPLEFNLSHSGDVTLIAVSRHPVGVDVEQWKPYDFDQLAQSVFSDYERAALLLTHPTQKQAAFFTGWTRKEAYVKATGLGFSSGLTYFDVAIEPAARSPLRADRRAPEALERWSIRNVTVPPGYSASLVVVHDIRCVTVLDALPFNALPAASRG